MLSSVGAADRRKIHQLDYDFRGQPGDVQRALSELTALTERVGNLGFLLDEATADSDCVPDFICQVMTRVATMSLWTAGLWIIKQPPAGLCVCTLTCPLRTPPNITREVAESRLINNILIPMYSGPALPPPTQGPQLQGVRHKGQPGHSGGHPCGCEVCADWIKDTLDELGVSKPGSGLSYRDVFILYNADPSVNDPLVQRLQGHHQLPVLVVTEPLSEDDRKHMATPTTDRITIAHCDLVSGLERRVVVGMGAGADITKRSHAISRSIAFVGFIDPPPGWCDDNDDDD